LVITPLEPISNGDPPLNDCSNSLNIYLYVTHSSAANSITPLISTGLSIYLTYTDHQAFDFPHGVEAWRLTYTDFKVS